MYPNILNWIEISWKRTMADMFLSVCNGHILEPPPRVYQNIYRYTETFICVPKHSLVYIPNHLSVPNDISKYF